MTPESSQANWHLIHHHHITKLFDLLNQNTMFITDNKHSLPDYTQFPFPKIYPYIIHHIFYSKQYNNSHKVNSSPLISNHILEQNTIKGNKLRQHISQYSFGGFFYVFSPQTPFLVVQSTVRSFPQVTIIPQKNTTRFATELQDRGIFNLESEYHSQH